MKEVSEKVTWLSGWKDFQEEETVTIRPHVGPCYIVQWDNCDIRNTQEGNFKKRGKLKGSDQVGR